jgi:hypothetical protein
MQRWKAVLISNEADGGLPAQRIVSGRWRWGALRLGGKVKMIFIEILPEKIIIGTKH